MAMEGFRAHSARGMAAILSLMAPLAHAVAPSGYPVSAVPAEAVRLEADGFWQERLRVNGAVTLPHVLKQCELTGRIDNFERAAGKLPGAHVGFHFNDSDVYKVVEGGLRQMAIAPDPAVQKQLDAIIAKIAGAQQKDGYIHPWVTLQEPSQRWKKPELHELYSIGHLIEAGAEHFRLTGRRELLDVAERAARRVRDDFRPGVGPLAYPSEHQQIEIGLVSLFEVTGERGYLELARRLLDARGRADGGRQLMGPYNQDHVPVTDQHEAVGHAVRALYQYTAMADVAAHTGDANYRRALEEVWKDVFTKKVYVTGGVGASGGNEGFSKAYDLPNVTAYSETCAAVGTIMWNERMFRLTGEARFMDVVERTLYNALLSGVALSGDRFFYPNRLETFRGASRSPWFDCACCPSNVVRFIPEVAGLAFAVAGDALYINQFMSSSAAPVVAGAPLPLATRTNFPLDGKVSVKFGHSAPRKFAVLVRIPDWARGRVLDGSLYQLSPLPGSAAGAPVIKVNGTVAEWRDERGYARLERDWQPGDTLELELPMLVQQVSARAEVVAADGRVAVQRGPLVYCAEGLDQGSHPTVMDLMVDRTAAAEVVPATQQGAKINLIKTKARLVERDASGAAQAKESIELTLRPYFTWANRTPTAMQVWLAARPEAARPAPAATLATTSKVTTSTGAGGSAVNDQIEPRSSADVEVPVSHWWPKTNTTEWIEYAFPRQTQVSACEVYWFSDSENGGGCGLPRSWRILYRDHGEWKPVAHREVYTIGRDRWSRVSFQPVTTDALRLEVVLPENLSAGIHEWKVEESTDK